jgi:hypothetical protein
MEQAILGGNLLQNIGEAVITYLDAAGRFFQQTHQHVQEQSAIRVLLSPARLLLEAVLAAERSAEFATLVEATSEVYSATHPMMGHAYRDAVSSFFRRSGVYTSYFSRESIDPRVMADKFQSAFSSNTHRVKYLAPLELVSFGLETIDCGSYQIRKYSCEQLEDLLENNVRSVFYQNLRIDTTVLQEYWFIVVEGIEAHPLCDDPWKEMDSSGPVEFRRVSIDLRHSQMEFTEFCSLGVC